MNDLTKVTCLGKCGRLRGSTPLPITVAQTYAFSKTWKSLRLHSLEETVLRKSKLKKED